MRRPSTFSAWFHLACPGDLNPGWPHLHLYEVNTSGTQTPLTDAELDQLVKDVREAVAGWSLAAIEGYIVGGSGRVMTYSREGRPDMLLAFVPVEQEQRLTAQADYVGRN